MIEILAALAIQTALQRDAPVLIDQSLTRVINGYGDMAEAVGQCSLVYPGGGMNPYVMQARQDVRDLGVETLTFETDRMESILFASGAQRAPSHRRTVMECVTEVEDPARNVSAYVQGLLSLVRTIERDKAEH